MKSAKIKERELIIELSNKKKTCREIASILGVSKSKAAFWVDRFKRTESLEDEQKTGRPTPLTKSKLDSIFFTIKSRINTNGKRRAGFSSKEALEIIANKTGRTYTPRHVQRILHKIGFSLVTPREGHIKKDMRLQDNFREEFKKNSRRNIWVTQ